MKHSPQMILFVFGSWGFLLGFFSCESNHGDLTITVEEITNLGDKVFFLP